jgi:tetraacyldisaccharide 4'-kinase
MISGLGPQLASSQNSPMIFAVRFVLLPFYLLYLFVITVRNALYDTGMVQPSACGVPVISVGNLTVGGTGKTPLIIALAERAVAAGRKVAIVARGYGAVADEEGRTDEVALLAARVPEANVVMAPNKRLGAQQAAAAGADVILVDDGLQHRRLHRDLEIVVVDARQPVSNGYVVPLGGLREPASALGRADVVVLTHHEGMSADHLESVKATLGAYRRGVQVVLGRHTPLGVRPAGGGDLQPPESLAGQELYLFCGIASPDGFRQTVEDLGAHVTGIMGFPDHHEFTAASLAAVRSEARTAQLICTEKDAAKVAAIPGSQDVLCLVIEMELDGELPSLPGIDG